MGYGRGRTRLALSLAGGLLWRLPRKVGFWLLVAANVVTVHLFLTPQGYRHPDWLGLGLATFAASYLACPRAAWLAVTIPATAYMLLLIAASWLVLYGGGLCVVLVFLVGGLQGDATVIGFGFTATVHIAITIVLLKIPICLLAMLAGYGDSSPALPGREEDRVATDEEAREEAMGRLRDEFREQREGGPKR